MAKAEKFYELSNQVRVPGIGFGTWRIENGATAVDAVKEALRCGYRHIDTAAAYGNEESVGLAIKQSGIPRKELFLTSKLWNPMHGYENTLKAFEQSLARLQTDYLDLYLIHWPNPVMFRDNWQEANTGSWKAFEEFYQAGRIRAIGVSNFRVRHLEALAKTASVAPMVNQIRLCPGETQDELVAYCREHGMLLEAYSPLGSGKVFGVPELERIARAHGKSVAQVAVRWSLERGYLPLPKSTNAQRIRANLNVYDFELTEEEHRAIAALAGCCGCASDPDTATF